MVNKVLDVVSSTVVPIGIEDELCVGQVPLEDERIHGVDDHVVAAIRSSERHTRP
jgi:hypothetical protein